MDRVTVLIVVIGVLGISCFVLIVRLFQYKKQIRSFTKRIEERQKSDMNQAVEVELFDKDIVKLAVVLNDYTKQQKQLTIELAKDRERLKHVIAGISHDFRTPLTSAYGYLQLVKKCGELSGKNQEYLDISMDKTKYLKELSDEFFELSAMEAKLEQVELERVHLNKLLQECILGQYDWIMGKGLETAFTIPEQSVYVLSNEMYLKRMVENIFSNMEKYAKTKVGVRLELREETVEFIAFNDTDLEEVDTKKVFEPFYRGDSRSEEGCGLGLYVVKGLAEAMGYQVTSSIVDKTFEIHIVMGICEFT